MVPAQDDLTTDLDTSDDDMESKSSNNDQVFADTADIDKESTADEIEKDECDNDSCQMLENCEKIFTKTRSGRAATNWKVSQFMSI